MLDICTIQDSRSGGRKISPARKFCSFFSLARLFVRQNSKSLFILRNVRSCITEKLACQNKRSEAHIFKPFSWPSVFLKLPDEETPCPLTKKKPPDLLSCAWQKSKIVFILVFALGIHSFCFAQGEKGETEQQIDGFSLVQYEDGGDKKWELNGKSADVEDEKVKINEISAVAFTDDATLKLKAKEGSFNREDQLVHLADNVVIKATDGTALRTNSLDWDAKGKSVFTDEEVSIKKADFQVDGKGAEVDLENRTAELKKDVVANIKSSEVGFSQTTDDRRLTTITCDGPLEINYKKNKATFKNNVEVQDAEGNILADRIDVYFGKDTRRVRVVVARGNVKIVNEGNVTYSEKAIYLVEQGRVVLPKRPKLVIQREEIGGF